MIGETFVYLDVCALALFLAMIFMGAYRKIGVTSSGRCLMTMFVFGFIAALTDILSVSGRLVDLAVNISTLLFTASCNVIAFLFAIYMISLTDNGHKFYNKFWLKFLLILPLLAIIGLLVSNFWTDWVYTIINGIYYKGMLTYYTVMYSAVFIYLLISFVYFIKYRVFFNKKKKFAIILVYPLMVIAIIIEYFKITWLLEPASIAISCLIFLTVLERPEDAIEISTGLKSYTAFVEDSFKAEKTKKVASLIYVRIINDIALTSKMGFAEQVSLKRTIGDLMKNTARDFNLKGYYYCVGSGQYSAVLNYEGYDNAESFAMTLRRRLNVPVKTDFGIVDLCCNVALVNCPDDINDSTTATTFLENFVHIPGVLDSVLDLSKIPNRRDFEINMNMASIIKRGLMKKNFEVYFQPIYSVKDRSFTRAEALLRLIDDIYGEISPSMFLPEAERNGTIHRIGDVVFDKVCQFIASDEFKECGLEKVEINLSVVQCTHEDLPIHIMDAVKRYNVDPKYINLEITETADAYSHKMMEDNIKVLKELGFTFSLDDYGQGYSNMDNVSQMPVDIIKLDRRITNSGNPEMKVMFEHSLKMIRDLKKKVVIEGVESADVLSQFETSLCDYIQGYYFSKPLKQDDFIQFIRDNNGISPEDLKKLEAAGSNYISSNESKTEDEKIEDDTTENMSNEESSKLEETNNVELVEPKEQDEEDSPLEENNNLENTETVEALEEPFEEDILEDNAEKQFEVEEASALEEDNDLENTETVEALEEPIEEDILEDNAEEQFEVEEASTLDEDNELESTEGLESLEDETEEIVSIDDSEEIPLDESIENEEITDSLNEEAVLDDITEESEEMESIDEEAESNEELESIDVVETIDSTNLDAEVNESEELIEEPQELDSIDEEELTDDKEPELDSDSIDPTEDIDDEVESNEELGIVDDIETIDSTDLDAEVNESEELIEEPQELESIDVVETTDSTNLDAEVNEFEELIEEPQELDSIDEVELTDGKELELDSDIIESSEDNLDESNEVLNSDEIILDNTTESNEEGLLEIETIEEEKLTDGKKIELDSDNIDSAEDINDEVESNEELGTIDDIDNLEGTDLENSKEEEVNESEELDNLEENSSIDEEFEEFLNSVPEKNSIEIDEKKEEFEDLDSLDLNDNE